MYYIYHIPGVKIGCTLEPDKRIKAQGFTDYEILEHHYDVYIASEREIELQKKYGYKVDKIPYYEALLRREKGRKVSLNTRHIWSKKVDWKYVRDIVSEKMKKVLLQYDLDGNFIKEWNCGGKYMPDKYKKAVEVARLGKGTLYGYQWKYKTSENYSKKINKVKSFAAKKTIQKDLQGNLIKIFDSKRQAAINIGVTPQSMDYACNNGSILKGFIWENI
jgi:hypothetical protein